MAQPIKRPQKLPTGVGSAQSPGIVDKRTYAVLRALNQAATGTLTLNHRQIDNGNSPYSPAADDVVIEVWTNTGSVTVNLPRAAAHPNRVLGFFKPSGSNSLIIKAQAGDVIRFNTIAGVASNTSTAAGGFRWFLSNGAGGWLMILHN